MRKGEVRKLVESTADPAFSVDVLNGIESWNQAAVDFFGISKEEAIGKSCDEIIRGYDECGPFCSKECCVFDAALNKKQLRNFDLQVESKSGRVWCNVSVMIADVDESVNPTTIHILRLIDVRKRLEVLVRDFVVNETSVSKDHAKELTMIARTPVRETPLTSREMDVLALLAEGRTTGQMAKTLSISPTTINNHVQHILKKLNAHSRLEAVRRAERGGLI